MDLPFAFKDDAVSMPIPGEDTFEEGKFKLDPSKSPKEIADRESALGQAIRNARMNAKQGDVLTPAVARVFRRIIRTEFAHRSRLALKNREEAQDELPAFTPMVNQI